MAGTKAFQSAFRTSQGKFRQSSKTISEAGRTPDDDKGKRHAHLLAVGHENENLIPSLRGSDGALHFFRQRNLHWWKSSRSGDDFSRDTPTRNLASSQVSCVNFLLPLSSIEGALEASFKEVDPDLIRIEPIQHNGSSSKVEFEWIGCDGCLEGGAGTRGANVTSADALLLAKTASGKRAYLIEWKCCEEYLNAEFLGDGTSGAARRRRYSTLYANNTTSFHANVPLDALLYDPFYQLMRLQLLGDKMVAQREFGIKDFRVIVVCPQENVAYRKSVTSPSLAKLFPDAISVHDAFNRCIRTPNHICVTSQSELLAALRFSSCATSLSGWIDYHGERYGW